MSEEMFISENANMSQVIEDLIENFAKYRNSYNKKEIIKGIIENEDIPKVLINLIEKNSEEVVVYILENFSFQKDNDYNEVLFLSISKNKYSIAECLIKGEYVNTHSAKDSEGNTALLLAAIYSNIQITKLLLKNAAELLEVKNKHGMDALTISVYNNDNLMFFLLVNNLKYSIFNINELCKLAIRNENFEILDYLTCNKTYTDDPSLLHHACAQKSLHIFNHVLNLVKKYNELDSNGETPLHWAVFRGTYHIVEALVKMMKEQHINIDPKSKYGITPLHMALIKQDKNTVQLLYEAGADINELDNEGNSIVHMICAFGDLKWLRYIIKHFHVNCYQKNNKGDTPFMIAILNGRYDIVEFFIDKIPNLNWKNKFGQSPLHAAVFANQIKIVELLLKYKADLTVKDINDLTPYHYAYIEKKTEMIKVIHSILNVDKV